MRLTCPYCGPRDVREFSYLGDATVVRPDTSDLTADLGDAVHDYVYLRDNPAGPHRERWYHGAGCRSWIEIERDTRTHAVLPEATS